MPLDQYATLGRSGLRVSPLCLGAMTFGEDLGWGTSVEESQQIIDRYIELGGNFIDTANFYTRSHSEKIRGSGRKSLINACENSLRRLQTDYIDLYWLHIWDANTPIEETMAALDDLVAAGKVRYIGVSDTPAWKIVQANLIARFHGWSSFIGLQVEYSLLERAIEQELVPMANEFGLGITPWSPLKSGVLSGKYTRANSGENRADRGAMVDSFLNDKTYTLIDELKVIADAHQTNVASVALAWVHAQAGVSSVIIGARRLSQLEDNVRAVDVDLTADELARLEALTRPRFGFPNNMLDMAPGILNGGTAVNGVAGPISEYVMPEGAQPY
jgi:aryl-alcohol dehydrogenase-like predicted oxidoreductase